MDTERSLQLCFAMAALLASCAPRPSPAEADLVVVYDPDRGPEDPPPGQRDCAPGAPPIVITGEVRREHLHQYLLLPFRVAEGTTRVEVGYAWRDDPAVTAPGVGELVKTVLDLGLWDERGGRSTDGFRGWSGSRQGNVGLGQPPIFVQADRASRAYRAGPVRPGIWTVELGVGAVGAGRAGWTVTIRCLDPPVGEPPASDPVDPTWIARPGPAWFHGDMHMHAYHSSGAGPTPEAAIAHARAAGLDFLPITEYVVGWHWEQWGAAQRAHPDLLIWPGREIITYFGHVNTIGETPSVIEYRHGFRGASIGRIQRLAIGDGALVQINHPTTFPGPVFSSFCRGCEFTLYGDLDLSAVDTIEILTGPVVAHLSDAGGPSGGPGGQNPFTLTAIQKWEELLRAGYKITGVSGSDDKSGRLYGSSATAVWADELSREALKRAIRAGHVYVRTRGVGRSPALEMHARTSDGQRGMFGDTLVADAAEVTVTVTGGAGQVLQLVRNGTVALSVPIPGSPHTFTFPATRAPHEEGPLGTFWRVQTLDRESLTAVGNPIFLRGRSLPGISGAE